MTYEYKNITPRIHLLTFKTQLELTSTFVRFQEYYESPKFRGECFTLNEFKKWYTKDSPNGQKTGKFTYFTDWNGFNIPSYVLKPFYAGKFDPLSEKEKDFLELFKDAEEPFYIIGIHEEKEDNALEHEIAHGLFYTNEEYRDKALKIISEFDDEPMREELRRKSGYHEEVLDDEVHAYSIDTGSHFKTPIPPELSRRLIQLFESYYKG